jgi:hypothetical protein
MAAVGRVYDAIDERLADWICRQPVFFTATAPAGGDGHVNVSPKGLDTLAVLGPTTVAYLDLTGSGVETIAHLRQNGRICVMLCAFTGPPRILRLQGRGQVLEPGHPEFAGLVARFPPYDGIRSVIRVRCDRIADSCGYGVPLLRFEGDRETLPEWAARKGTQGLEAYRAEKNARSVDGLPGLTTGRSGP